MGEKDISLRELLNVVITKWHIIVLSFCVSLIVGSVYTFTRKVLFKAYVILQIEEPVSRKTLLEDLFIYGRPSRIDTEVEIIKSRSVAERVVENLNLDVVVEGVENGVKFNLVKAQVKEDLIGVPIHVFFTGKDCEFKVSSPSYKLSEGDYLFEFTRCTGKGKAVIKKLKREDAVKSLREGIITERIGENTNLIKVAYVADSPIKAAQIVNEVANSYISFNKEKWTEDISQTMDFISSQLDRVKAGLEEAEREIDEYRKKYGIAELSRKAEDLLDQVASLETQKAQIDIQLFELNKALQSLKKDSTELLPSFLFSDEVIQSLISRLAELNLRRYTLLQKFTEKHPEVVMLDEERMEIIKEIENGIRKNIETLNQRKSAIEEILSRYEKNIREYPETERTLLRLKRKLKVNEDIYTFLLTKHEEVRIAKAASVGNVKVIDYAVPPDKPFYPNKKKLLLFSIFIGTFGGFLLAFVLYFFSDTINSPEEVESLTSSPILGVIPDVTEGMFNSIPISEIVNNAHAKEAGRVLKTNLMYSIPASPPKVIMLTSATSGEGKTSVVLLLAKVLAEGNKRVIVVDCDLRKMGLSSSINSGSSKGVVDLIGGFASLDEVVKRWDDVHFIPAGTKVPVPSSYLESPQFEELIGRLRGDYDYVIIDTPPLLSVTDALIVSKKVDAVLMVVMPYKTLRSYFMKAVRFLRNIKAPIQGIVINMAKMGRRSYYYYFYYYPEEEGEGEREPSYLFYIKKYLKRRKR